MWWGLCVWVGESYRTPPPSLASPLLSLSVKGSLVTDGGTEPLHIPRVLVLPASAAYYGLFVIGSPSLRSLPPAWLYVNPVGTQPVGEVGAGGSCLGGAQETRERPRWDRCAVGAVHCAVVLNSLRALALFWERINNLPWGCLAVQTCPDRISVSSISEITLHPPRMWPELVVNNSLVRSVALLLISFGLSSWMVSAWTHR